VNSHHQIFHYHSSLLEDRPRTEAFQRAIAAVVKPGDVVVDVGCGSGILSFLACAAGARRVYSIERGPVVEVARAVAQANGLADRIVFLEGSSRELALPERAAVLMGEIIGNGGLEENILGFFIDARDRFLAPGGTLIPRSLAIQGALVCEPDIHARLVGAWNRKFGVDFTSMRGWAARQTYPVEIDEQDLRGAPVTFATISLPEVVSPFVSGTADFVVSDPTAVHGLAVWFSAELTPEILLTNAPPLRTPSWKHLFLPLEVPLSLDAGDTVRVTISTHDGLVWRWQGRSTGARSPDSPSAVPTGLPFDHSTFAGFPMRKGALLRHAQSAGALSERRAAAARLVIDSLRGEGTFQAVGMEVARQFPELFATAAGATEFVRRLAGLIGD